MAKDNHFTYKLWLHLEQWNETTGESTDMDLPDMLFESKWLDQANHFKEILADHCDQLNKLMNGERD